MDEKKRSISTTTDGKPPAPGFENAGAPQPTGPDGQHKAYWVLSEEERAKGYSRPVRHSYRHVGPPRHGQLRPLTEDEERRHEGRNYVGFEEYSEDHHPVMGKFWTQAQIDRANERACDHITSMADSIGRTYARNPSYYGSTFCCHCRDHFPVAEFTWVDSPSERVGS